MSSNSNCNGDDLDDASVRGAVTRAKMWMEVARIDRNNNGHSFSKFRLDQFLSMMSAPNSFPESFFFVIYE